MIDTTTVPEHPIKQRIDDALVARTKGLAELRPAAYESTISVRNTVRVEYIILTMFMEP